MVETLIDGYFHIGLPRFQTAEAALAAMDAAGISKGIVCPFETCPDLREVHRAYCLAPERFRVFGLALGAEHGEIEAGLHAQFDAGFEGMRLSLERLAEAPYILDVIGERGGILLAVGSDALASQAAQLHAFLEKYPDSVVISPHFAGPTDPAVFEANPDVRALYTHPRFHVVLSRQTLQQPQVMEAWTRALITHVTWDRMMWGSEAPVLYWRDETLKGVARWIERFSPAPAQLAGFAGGNAGRVVFDRPIRPPRALALPYEPFDYELKRSAPMFPNGLDADTRLPGPLVAAWKRAGGDTVEPLSAFVSRILLKAVKST